MTNLELAQQQGNQAAPNIIDAIKDNEIDLDLDTTLAQQQGNQATPLIAESLANTESYDAIKQQGSQATPLIVDTLIQPVKNTPYSPVYFGENSIVDKAGAIAIFDGEVPFFIFYCVTDLGVGVQSVIIDDTIYESFEGHTFGEINTELIQMFESAYSCDELSSLLPKITDWLNNNLGRYLLPVVTALEADHITTPTATVTLTDGTVFEMPVNVYTSEEQLDADTVSCSEQVSYLQFTAQEANSTVSMISTLPTAPDLEYSTDSETWQEWQHTTADDAHTFDTLILTEVGDRVYLRGDNPNGFGARPEGAENFLFSHFEMTGKIAAGGNIMSLIDKNAETTEIPALGFTALFSGLSEEDPNTSLISAAAMHTVTNISDAGCNYMYGFCTALTAAAAMSALVNIGDVGCTGMYAYDTALTAAADMPQLTTISLAGCSSMYFGCTSLASAAAMPALTDIGESGCSDMYYGCISLTAAADMPNLTDIGDDGCTSMYDGCTSLASAAAMPSVTTIGEGGCEAMYDVCTFNMSDDGTTLNFDFPTPPVTTTGENPTTYATAYDVAIWMGNTNGF